jgi:hypothetical protein
MAIVFTQPIDVVKLHQAYNNCITRFTTDVDPLVKVCKKAEISGFGFFSVIYPNPEGVFYFNFKEYFTAAINTKNFADDVDFVLDSLDMTTIQYDVTDGHFLKGDVEFKIIFDDTTDETETINLSVLAAVTQLQTFDDDKITIESSQFVPLVPALNRNELTNLKVWGGYPFEFTAFTSVQTNEIAIYNDTSVTGLVFIPESELTSLVLTDGLNTFEELGLAPGWNKFHFEVEGFELNNKMNILYEQGECGVYVKFLNRFGRWTYWLFSKNFFEIRSSKYMGEIENDFSNIEDTISPTLQIGKISDSSLKVAAKSVTPEFAILLEDIFDSPKIMIFNGKRGEVNTYKNWFETRLKTSSFQNKAPNKKLKNFYLEFDNPLRNTITL